MTSEYSIVIPFHSNPRRLEHCLETLIETCPSDVAILVVANNEDETQFAFNVYDKTRVKVIKRNKSLGYAGAANLGVDAANSSHVILCDHDTAYGGDWFHALIEEHNANKKAGITASKLLNPDTARIIDYGIAFTNVNCPHPFQDRLANYGLTQETRTVQACCSASAVIDKSQFYAVGGFHDDGGSYYNDISLCLRLNEAGRSCQVTSKAIAYHKSSFRGSKREQYKSLELKGDLKAQFTARYHDRYYADMDAYLTESIGHEVSHLKQIQFILVDLTNIIDREWYHQRLQEHLKIIDVFRFPTGIRDCTHISLLEAIPRSLVRIRVPFILFVDRYISLKENHLWWGWRGEINDIIVDRNGNIVKSADLQTS